MFFYSRRLVLVICSLFFLPVVGHSDNNLNNLQQQSHHQQDRQQALQKQLSATGKDVLSDADQPIQKNQSLQFVDDDVASCTKIKEVILEKDSDMPRWSLLQRLANKSIGHCMNPHNIKAIAIILQNKLIAAGYITSRSDLPAQNVSNGTLRIKFISGRMGHLFFHEDAKKNVSLSSAFPTKNGKILNLRDIEQGMENMQSLPDTAVHINLIPSQEAGKTDVEIERQQNSFWHLAGWIDNSGSKSTGRYQGGMALYLSNPLHLNDLLYLSATHDLHRTAKFGSKSSAISYSVPYGYWSLNLFASESKYHQPLGGEFSAFQYRGQDRFLSGTISRVLHRGAQQKTTFSTQIIRRNTRYHVADVELELQKMDSTLLRFDLAHRHYVRDSVLDADLGFQRNVHWFGGKKTAAEEFGLASELSRIITLDLQATVPFSFAGLSMSWQQT